MSAYYLNAHILFVFLQFYHIVSALSNPLSFYFLGTSAGIFLCTPRSILPFSSNSSSVLISSLSAMYFPPRHNFQYINDNPFFAVVQLQLIAFFSHQSTIFFLLYTYDILLFIQPIAVV